MTRRWHPPTSSRRACARARTFARAGTAAMGAGCATPSRRVSRSVARRRCCASRRAWPRGPAPTGRPTSRRTAGSWPRWRGSSPGARDYLDVYDRAGALGPRAILAHAIHLSDREVARLAESGARVAHCPASNLFLASGTMPLARYRAAGIPVGLGSDVAGGPELSIFANMRAGAYVQSGLRVLEGSGAPAPLGPLDWLRLGTLEGARALGRGGGA